jgi:hypothetical protein
MSWHNILAFSKISMKFGNFLSKSCAPKIHSSSHSCTSSLLQFLGIFHNNFCHQILRNQFPKPSNQFRNSNIIFSYFFIGPLAIWPIFPEPAEQATQPIGPAPHSPSPCRSSTPLPFSRRRAMSATTHLSCHGANLSTEPSLTNTCLLSPLLN